MEIWKFSFFDSKVAASLFFFLRWRMFLNFVYIYIYGCFSNFLHFLLFCTLISSQVRWNEFVLYRIFSRIFFFVKFDYSFYRGSICVFDFSRTREKVRVFLLFIYFCLSALSRGFFSFFFFFLDFLENRNFPRYVKFYRNYFHCEIAKASSFCTIREFYSKF